MPTRFSDDQNNTDGSDFIVRRRVPVSVQIVLIFTIAFVAIYLTASAMNDTGSRTLFFVTLSLSIGSLSWFTVYLSSRLRDLVLATEFQNAMLASAAQLSTRFCLITKRDGSIVYIDPGFQKLFPGFMQGSDRNLDGLFASAAISRDTIQKIILILQQGETDRVVLNLKDAQGAPFSIMLSVDPLPRPKGYFLLRGRDYIEKRSADSAETTMGPSHAALAQALHMLPEGILIADGSGVITYVNRTLEEWLGYDVGELLTRPYKTGQIIYQYGGMDSGRLNMNDYDGEVVLQRRDRSLITLMARQASLGKGAGISAIIGSSELLKKK